MSATFQTADTKTIDVNGTRFVFREIEPGGVPVVFLHHLTAGIGGNLPLSCIRPVRRSGREPAVPSVAALSALPDSGFPFRRFIPVCAE